jgi:lipoprotein-anchoring transpeptidase ErfK/SrfK
LLLVLLAGGIAVFAVVFVRNQRQNRADAAAAAPASGVSPMVTSAEPATPVAAPDEADALVTQTPTARPGVLTNPGGAGASRPSLGTSPTTTAVAGANPQPAINVPAVVLSSKPLADAKAKADAGKLLEARDIYNAALISGKLTPPQAKAAKHELAELNDTIVFSPSRYENDPWGGTFTIPPGGVLDKIAKRFNVTAPLLQRINDIKDPRRIQAGQSIKIVRGPMHAVVDKSDFTLDLYFGAPGGPGSSYITTFRVGLGKDDSTPVGKWLVEPGKKLVNPVYHSPRGEGVIEADDPKNPLGEFWIALQGIEGGAVGKLSYGIHGTIEPHTIGTMASMGCIRMVNEDVARVYEMLIEGKSTVLVQE